MGTELNFHLFSRWSCILVSYCCFSLAMCKSHSAGLYVTYGRCQRRRGARARGVWKTRTCPWNRNMALRLTMALPDRSWNRTRTRTSARKRTPEKWNQDKTSIVNGKACVLLQAAVRGNFHRAWTKSSERTRTRKSWNQDKTSIALVARHVDFRCRGQSAVAWAGARGVLEWKTRACTMQKEYIDQEQDTRTMESGQNLNRKDKGFPGHSDTRKSIFKYLKNC